MSENNLVQNGDSEVSSARSEGIVTVTSAEDAARVRAERVWRAELPLISRDERNAEREKQGNADHSVTGLMLYALSTVCGIPSPEPFTGLSNIYG